MSPGTRIVDTLHVLKPKESGGDYSTLGWF